MKFKHYDLEIKEEAPFENCKLGRLQNAKVLTSIVGNYADGFVLGINNEWGAGKTTFVKMWDKYLKSEGYRTLYFNAWENDFDSEPLAAIISELKSLLEGKKSETFDKIVSHSRVFAKALFPAIVKAAANKYIDTDSILDIFKDGSTGLIDVFNAEIEEYSSKKQSLFCLKEELQKYISEQTDGKPLVFIIDELDRCRPDYAVEVLEKIKHFFSVPGIVFVLSIDKLQLANSIRGFYGSDKIEAEEYLRRFIDVEYRLPEPENYCAYLFDYFQFSDLLENRIGSIDFEKETFIEFSEILCKSKGLSLRQQEKLFAHARLAFVSFYDDEYLFPNLFIFLVFLRNFRTEIYNEIIRGSYSVQELIDIVEEDIFKKEIDSEKNHLYKNIAYLETLLMFSYRNYLNALNQEQQILLINGDLARTIKLTVNTLVSKKLSSGHLERLVQSYYNKYAYFGLDQIFKKIDLLYVVDI